MNGRRYALAILGLAMAMPGAADAQVTARVHVDWQWSSNDHRTRYDDRYRTARLPRVGAVHHAGYYDDVLYRPVAGIHIPRGHRPRRGFCRLWYPGVAPGHQPRAVRCEALRGLYRPGVLIVTWRGALRPMWDAYTQRYWTGYRDVRRVAWRDGRRYYDRDGDWWDGDGRYRGQAGVRFKAPVRPRRDARGERYDGRERNGERDRSGERFERDHRGNRTDGRVGREESGGRGDPARSGRGGGPGNGQVRGGS